MRNCGSGLIPVFPQGLEPPTPQEGAPCVFFVVRPWFVGGCVHLFPLGELREGGGRFFKGEGVLLYPAPTSENVRGVFSVCGTFGVVSHTED